jgi:hypothetical protein
MHHSQTASPPPLAVSNSPAPGTTKMDKMNPADWLKIQPNSVITLSDAQAIADAQRRGLGVRGIDYTVSSVAHIKQLDNLSTHVFLSLADTEQNVYLMAKIVDQAMDLYAYFEVPGLAGGTRQELLDRGMQWLFQEPANPNSFSPSELRYTMTLEQKVPQEGKGDLTVKYIQKSQGELQCNYKENPPRTGLSGSLLATLIEYKAEQTVENPEFLILEVGENRSNQSFIQFYLGCEAKLSEVDVLAI